MRYLVGLGAVALLAILGWIYPPVSTPHDPLVSSGFVGFVAAWTLFLIPASLTLVVITGFDYRTENVCSSCNLFERLPDGLGGQAHGHEQALWNGDGLLETTCKEPQTQPKQT